MNIKRWCTWLQQLTPTLNPGDAANVTINLQPKHAATQPRSHAARLGEIIQILGQRLKIEMLLLLAFTILNLMADFTIDYSCKPGFGCSFAEATRRPHPTLTSWRTLQLDHFPAFMVFVQSPCADISKRERKVFLLQTLLLKRFHRISEIGGGYLRRMICGGKKKASLASPHLFPSPTDSLTEACRSKPSPQSRSVVRRGHGAALQWMT